MAQTLKKWEVILVDDGATDDTGRICDEYAERDRRFSVIHTQNQGLPSARNTGMEYAHGELLYFMDPDDWIESECFSRYYETYKQYDSDIVHFGINEVHDNKIARIPNKFGVFTGTDIWSEYTCQHIGFSQKALHGFYKGESIKAYMVVSIPDILYNYTIRKDSLSNGKKNIEYIFDYKYKMIEETRRMRNLIKEFDLHDYYLGSHVLSCLR